MPKTLQYKLEGTHLLNFSCICQFLYATDSKTKKISLVGMKMGLVAEMLMGSSLVTK